MLGTINKNKTSKIIKLNQGYRLVLQNLIILNLITVLIIPKMVIKPTKYLCNRLSRLKHNLLKKPKQVENNTFNRCKNKCCT